MNSNYEIIGSHSSEDLLFRVFDSETEWRKVLDKLTSYKQLEENWDGEGARKPSQDLVDSMSHFLIQKKIKKESPPDRVSLTPDGDLVIEWQMLGSILELESSEPGHGEYMLSILGGETQFAEISWTALPSIFDDFSNSSSSLTDYSYLTNPEQGNNWTQSYPQRDWYYDNNVA